MVRVRKEKAKQPQRANPRARETHTRMIVGIDFGTTYSGKDSPSELPLDWLTRFTGVSMASANDTPDKIEVVSKWPGMLETRDKVPSIIAYDDSNTEAWGYDVKPGMVSSSWFKLGMTESGIPASLDDPLLVQAVGKSLLRIPEGKTAEELCQDYLTSLYQYIVNRLVRQFTKSVIDVTPIKFVLTAPADWGEKYKDKLLTAATAAGVSSRALDTVPIIDEPEAAALAAFETSQRFNLGLFKVKSPSQSSHQKCGEGAVWGFGSYLHPASVRH